MPVGWHKRKCPPAEYVLSSFSTVPEPPAADWTYHYLHGHRYRPVSPWVLQNVCRQEPRCIWLLAVDLDFPVLSIYPWLMTSSSYNQSKCKRLFQTLVEIIMILITDINFFLLSVDASVWSFILSQTKVPLAMATACDLTIGFDIWQLPSSNSSTFCAKVLFFVSQIIPFGRLLKKM